MTRITVAMHLRTPGFPRHPRDMALAAPPMAGYALAAVVIGHLTAQGYRDVEAIAENFGWWVEGRSPGSELACAVVLSSLARPGDDPGAVPETMVSIEPNRARRGLLWWRRDVGAIVARHSATVFGLLRRLDGIEILAEETAALG